MEKRSTQPGNIIVLVVLGIMGVIAVLLYGSLAVCLVMAVKFGLDTGKWDIAIITALITAVSTGAGAAAGFVGGVLSQVFGMPHPGGNSRSTDKALAEQIGSEIVSASQDKPIQTQEVGDTK